MPKPIDVSKTGYALDVKRYAALAEKGHTIRVLNDDGSLHMIMSIPQERLECCDAAKQLKPLREAAAALYNAQEKCTEPGCDRPATFSQSGHIAVTEDGDGFVGFCDEHHDKARVGAEGMDALIGGSCHEKPTAAPLRALLAVLAPEGKRDE